MSERWIVTGGCGFIGSNLVASLLEDRVDVVVVDTLVRRGSGENLAWLQQRAGRSGTGKLVHVAADVRNRTDVEHLFSRFGEGSTVVAHLASQAAMTTSVDRPRFDFEVNALGAFNVLEAVRTLAPDAAVLLASTSKVYGDLASLRLEETATRWILPDLPRGLDETTPLSFQGPHGCSKGAADQYFLDYHRTYGLKTVVLRHSSTYGAREFATYDQGWVGWFCEQALRQKREREARRVPLAFTIHGDGKQVRDLLYVDDAVRCHRLAAGAIKGIAGRAYNIGGGMENSLSLLELFTVLEHKLGLEIVYERLAPRASDQKVFVADGARAAADFGFSPQVGVSAGLDRMLEWLRR